MLLCDCCNQGCTLAATKAGTWHACQSRCARYQEGEWLCSECTETAAASGGSQHISSTAPIRILVEGKQLEWVWQFKYLGSQFSSAGSL